MSLLSFVFVIFLYLLLFFSISFFGLFRFDKCLCRYYLLCSAKAWNYSPACGALSWIIPQMRLHTLSWIIIIFYYYVQSNVFPLFLFCKKDCGWSGITFRITRALLTLGCQYKIVQKQKLLKSCRYSWKRKYCSKCIKCILPLTARNGPSMGFITAEILIQIGHGPLRNNL